MAYFQFYYPKRLSFSPVDYENPGLGGGESTVVLLTRTLAKMGHKVVVYNACWQPGIYDGVTWKGAWDIDDGSNADVRVSVRTECAVIENQARQQVFWMLDDRVDGAIKFDKMYPEGIVIVASNAMLRKLDNIHFRGEIVQIPLPVDAKLYVDSDKPSSSMICIHSSMPNRGLSELLRFWPRVHEQVPDAKLYVTSGWELWGYTKEEAKDRWCQTLPDHYNTDGIEFAGVLPRSKLVRLQNRVRFGVFPSYFPEMFCLSAAELESAGRPIIVSDYEALSERVIKSITGRKVAGDIRCTDVHNHFVENMIEFFTNDELVDSMGCNAKINSARYTPSTVTGQWLKMLKID